MMLPAIKTIANLSESAILNFELSTCNDLHQCRTIWNIIWSCVVTLFACIWLSIHINIPAPEDRRGTQLARRMWMMVLALIMPELIVGWAARQRKAAGGIAKENKRHKWTKTHGFFVVMGGFMEYENEQPVRTLDNDKDIPEKDKNSISESDIKDKSKGDVLSKGFALLQTGWFILQCISRRIEGLPTTQLEIATVAFAALNLATYILWWNKPLSVKTPVRVYKSGSEGPGKDEAESVTVVAQERKDENGPKERCVRRLWKWCKGLLTRFKRGLVDFPTGFKRGLVDFSKEVYRPIKADADEMGWCLILGFPFVPFVPAMIGTRAEPQNQKRVGTFSPKPDHAKKSATLKLTYSDELGYPHVMMGLVGIAFGAIHCIAWAFEFPSQTERLLWRISAISVTGVPLLVTFTAKFALDYGDDKMKTGNPILRNLALTLAFLILIPSVAVYISARLTLLVLPFMSLRSLPPDAYRTADWTRFIPHI